MTKPRSFAAHPDAFRAQAELLLRESSRKISRMPKADMHTLAHELHVHQMELEMQNEELRRVQLELEASRDRFATLYDFSPVGYLKLDDAGTIREANLTVAEQLGFKRKELIGKKLSRFLAPEAQDIFYLHRQKLRESGARQVCELKMLQARGGKFMGRLESIAVQDEPSGGRHFLTALSDITEELEAEAARAHLAAIVESSNDAIISHSLAGTITTWNAGAEKMFGYTRREIIGRPVITLVPPEVQEEFHQLQERFARGEHVESFETNRLAKNGRRISVSISYSLIKNNEGGVLGVSKIVRDVTRQKQAEAALRQSEHNLADFFDEAPLGLVWVRRDGQVLRMNRAQLELLGYQDGELINQPVSKFLVDEEVASDMIERLAKKETLKNFRTRLRAQDGSTRHVLIDANGLWHHRRLVHSRWFVRDISRRMELEREILAISEREKRRIGQDLHDELGQQLAGVEFAVQSLAGQLAPLSRSASGQMKEITGMVQRAMGHARELAHGLSPIGLEADGLMEGLGELAGRTRKVFRVDCRFRSKSRVMIHDHNVGIHLYRIAQEAVNNAIKHGKATQIDIALTVNKNRIILAVSDNGIGLPKKTSRQKEKGMGLRVMQYRAGAIGGSLVAQRLPNGGMTFVCCIKDYSHFATNPKIK